MNWEFLDTAYSTVSLANNSYLTFEECVAFTFQKVFYSEYEAGSS
jgi:hypothetical protein